MSKIKFDYFKVLFSKTNEFDEDNSPKSFNDILSCIEENIKDRYYEVIDGNRYVVTKFIKNRFENNSLTEVKGSSEIKNIFSSVIFSNIRMNEFPKVIDTNGKSDFLNLNYNQGLSEEVVFTYSHEKQVAVVQKNIHSISISGIEKYFNKIGLGIKVDLEPIVSGDAFARYEKMGIIKSFEFTLAGTDDFTNIDDLGYGVQEKLFLKNALRGADFTAKFSVGRKKTVLLEGIVLKIINFYNHLKNNDSPHIKKLKVSGKNSEKSKTEIIDLLEDRLCDTQDVVQNNRTIDTNDLIFKSVLSFDNVKGKLK